MAQSNPNLVDIFTDIAASIKAKTGETGLLYPVDFADEIAAIHTDPTLLEKNIVENGTYTAAQEGADGYSVVTVNVPQPNPFRDAWEAYKSEHPTNWDYAFYPYRGMLAYLPSLEGLSFAESGSVTSTVSMFGGCKNLVSVPLFNTSAVTTMQSMFSGCTSLASVPLFDTSSVENMREMFYNCSSLVTVPLFNTSHVTNMIQMFAGCSQLTSVPLLNTSGVTDMSKMFTNCSNLNTVPLFDLGNVTGMSDVFFNCSSLEVIPAFDVSKSAQYPGFFSLTFSGCSNLKEMHMFGMAKSFNISASTRFTRAALVEILTNLATITSTQTVTMGADNLAKLTDDDKAIALNKGWTLA